MPIPKNVRREAGDEYTDGCAAVSRSAGAPPEGNIPGDGAYDENMEFLEFEAVRTGSRWRWVLAVALAVVVGLPMAGMAVLVLVPPHLEYTVAGGRLTVTHGPPFVARERSWPLEAVVEAGPVDLPPGARRNGTSLPGYCAGVFRYPGIGTVWQATDCSSRAVLIEVEGADRPVVLTPPEPEAFLRALRGRGTYHHRFVRPSPAPAAWRLTQVMTVLGAVIALGVPLVLVLGPRRLRYELEPGGLRIRSFLLSKTVPLEGVTARRITAPRIGARLWGAGLPGYLTGLFTVEGRVTRVWVTSVKGDCVLLEGNGRPVLLSPADPGAFLEALRLMGVTVREEG